MPRVEMRALMLDHAEACDAIIASLPHFFGDPGGIADCARAVRSQPGVVAIADGAVAGFLTLERHNEESAEITWMAVHAQHRRGGLGRRLIDEALLVSQQDGVRMLSVLTAAPSPEEASEADGYAGTRAFYRTMGFVPLRELDLASWNTNIALILARAV